MKNLNNFILEKLILGKNLKPHDRSYWPTQLRDDYETVRWATTKKEKEAIAQKYNFHTELKIRPIQIAILDELRKLRNNKKEFDQNDLRDFFRYDIPDSYQRFEPYLKEEPIDFVKYMFKEYIYKCKNLNPGMSLSIADKHKLKRLNQLRQFLVSKGINISSIF